MKTLIQLLMICGLLTSGKLADAQQTENTTVNDYRVVAIKKNDVSVNSVSNEVQVIAPLSIFIPNAFTPNEDGMNDEFGIVGGGFDELTFYIFNRWGEVIFEASSADKKWDGTHQGKKCENGVYVYKVVARNKTSNQFFEKTGSVTLVI